HILSLHDALPISSVFLVTCAPAPSAVSTNTIVQKNLFFIVVSSVCRLSIELRTTTLNYEMCPTTNRRIYRKTYMAKWIYDENLTSREALKQTCGRLRSVSRRSEEHTSELQSREN